MSETKCEYCEFRNVSKYVEPCNSCYDRQCNYRLKKTLADNAPEMLEILIEISSLYDLKYLLKPIIEKATGLKIDEVLK